MKKIVHIDGMCCERCAKRVENRLMAAKNVISADVKFKKNIAVIRSRQEVENGEIEAIVQAAGFTVRSIEDK